MQKSIVIPLVALVGLVGCEDSTRPVQSAEQSEHSMVEKAMMPAWVGTYQ